MPQIVLMIGPKGSGKSQISHNLAFRTNMSHINFTEYLEANELGDCDDDTICQHLIKKLSEQIEPRAIIEDFPQNVY